MIRRWLNNCDCDRARTWAGSSPGPYVGRVVAGPVRGQGRRQDVAAGWAKNHKEGHIFKYNVECMQQPPRKKLLARGRQPMARVPQLARQAMVNGTQKLQGFS